MKKDRLKKAKVIVPICIAVILLLLFLPIPTGVYDDGGTREYSALTYKIVVWNKFLAEVNGDGSVGDFYTYHKTSVFWFPDNYKSIDDLWKMERNIP